MNINKYNIDEEFPFDKIYLGNPNGLQGGSYFSPIKMDKTIGVLIQMPKLEKKYILICYSIFQM